MQVRMTFFRFVPPAVVSALALSATLLSVPVLAQQAAPQQMPTPRYQSPGVAQPQVPVRVVNFPVTPPISPNGKVAEEIIVRVNDQIITRSDLERGAEILQGELAQNPGANDAAERQRNMLRDLIDQQLLISKAKELGVNADAEVVRRLDDIRKQNNLPSMEALEEAARKQGVSFEDFKANIRNSVMTQSVVRDEVGRTIRLTRADEQKYYDAHKEEFNQPEQVRLAEILVPTPATPDDAALAAAQAKADETYAKLKAGADFTATAKTVSGGPTAAQGGDLGVFRRGQLAKVLEDKTFALPVGGFTEPTRTRQGFVILKAVDHVQPGVPPLEKIEPEVQNAMYQQAVQPALRTYLTKLREDSYVDVKPGFVDTGASPKQTKPVFAAYAAPAPKKKVVHKRLMNAEKDAARLQKAGLTIKNGKAQPIAAAELDKHGKSKKIRREKVRFGQAPRTALPDAVTEEDGTVVAANKTTAPSASGQDALGTADTNPGLTANGGAGSGGGPGTVLGAGGGAAGSGTQAAGGAVAPGTQVAPVTFGNTVAATDVDPLAPPRSGGRKTRFSAREPEVKQQKVTKGAEKAIEHAIAKPTGPSTDEKQTAAVQSGALGLNGDTTKKKQKRQKGVAKERIQAKAPEQKPEVVDNGLPDRLHQQNGPQQKAGTPSASSTTGNLPAENSKQQERQRTGSEPVTKPTSDSTTLAPTDQPAPGTTLPAQTPSTNGVTTPSSNAPVPQTSGQPQ